MSRRVTDAATEVLGPDAYLSDAWYEHRRLTVSASEIAAVLGLSPYVSAFDLWWTKKTGEDSQPESKQMRRGKRLEGLILEDFTDEHPEFVLADVGLCVNTDRPWQACTPDALAYESPASAKDSPVAVLEAKTDGDSSGWGEQGTADIPVHYRCQVLWQMDCLGLTTAFVPMWLGVNYREYEIAYDPVDVALMRTAAQNFLASIRADREPDLDAHSATARRLKRLHPDMDDTEVVVPDDVADEYAAAVAAVKAAETDREWAENRLRAAIGRGRWALRGDGTKVATRSVYDVAERVQKVRAHTVSKLIPPRGKKPAGTTVKEAVTT